ncbi:hypothetical protein [Haladaptatus salinisoli]|nr:hypothetical protein [Haladaptatus salinisoli]
MKTVVARNDTAPTESNVSSMVDWTRAEADLRGASYWFRVRH